ncbi:MAG: C40 family peptidase [Desulfobacter sp.]|nr:MAG: C40 family peptidase [Desulfobacter sp.]
MSLPSKHINLLICFLLLAIVAGCSSAGHTPPASVLNRTSTDLKNLPEARRIVVGRAVESIGADYAWGGISPSTGFDCSGLVVYTHSAAGVTTPRTARAMFAGGRRVSNPIQPGDLVFFNSPHKSSSIHVGIFIGGNAFVHAPGRGKKVRQASLANPYFDRYFIGARSFL